MKTKLCLTWSRMNGTRKRNGQTCRSDPHSKQTNFIFCGEFRALRCLLLFRYYFFLSSLPPCLKAMYTLPVPYVLAYLPLRLPCATALAHRDCVDSFCLCVFNRQTIVRESGAARLPAIVCFSPFSHASFA